MAEINIQRKGGMPFWTVVAVLALLAAVVVIWVITRDRNVTVVADRPAAVEPVPDEPPAPTVGVGAAPAVQAYVDYVERDEARMGPDHVFSSAALHRLADAIQALADQGRVPAVADELATLRAQANELRASPPDVLTHAGMVRAGFQAAAGAISTLHAQRFADDANLGRQVEDLERRAAAVEPGQPLLEQRQDIHGFLEAAGGVLQRMERVL
jgi:hypothetical protein